MNKREAKKRLKCLANPPSGLAISHKYAHLIRARELAKEFDLPLPEHYQRELTKTAKLWLYDAIEYHEMHQTDLWHSWHSQEPRQLKLFSC